MKAIEFVTLLDHPVIKADDSLGYASKIIINKELELLPVVADNGDFFGVIIAATIAEALLNDTHSSEQLAWEHCEREVCTVHPDVPVKEAVVKMKAMEADYFAVAEDGRYIGFATTKDLIEALDFSAAGTADPGENVA